MAAKTTPASAGQVSATPATQQATTAQEMDPVFIVKNLVPRLKETLAKLMRVAAQEFHQYAQMDACVKGEQPLQTTDKCLEEFYSLCDQIELNLKLALDCHQQHADNIKNAPVPVHQSELAASNHAQEQQYSQYLQLVNAQVNTARAVHDVLVDFSNKLGEKPTFGGLPQTQGLG